MSAAMVEGSIGANAAGREGVVIPRIAIAAAVSLLLHALLMWGLRIPRPGAQPDAPHLTAYLKPPEKAPAKPRPPARAKPPPAKPPIIKPAAEVRAPQAPPQAVPVKPEPQALPPPAPEPPPPVAATPPVINPVPLPAEPDFMAALEARRRARGEPSAEMAAAQRVENANKGALASAALAVPAPSSLNPERRQNGYGTFDIRRRAVDYAEYMFNGWNENFRRHGQMLIEVRKGEANSIELAVIRSMIEIIRRTESGDFVWRSHRLGRVVMLSARARDNATLEEFLMLEFADDFRRYR
jgi:outer membrane biosynthesis protein TonB